MGELGFMIVALLSHHCDQATTGKVERHKVADDCGIQHAYAAGTRPDGHFSGVPCSVISASRPHLLQHIATSMSSTRLLAPAPDPDALPWLQTKSPSLLPSVSPRVWQAMGGAKYAVSRRSSMVAWLQGLDVAASW